MPSIEIVLACYNGERYLRPQLDSLFAQTDQDWSLLVRDDGSTDGTVDIINAYAVQYPGRILLIDCPSSIQGALGNFDALLNATTAPYVMCCDQDDWWTPTKVASTRARMQALERQIGAAYPLIVHTDLEVVDANLRTIDASLWHFQFIDPRRDQLNRLLMQNVVTGCTMMVNRRCVELSLPIPRQAMMHDWWMALVAATEGAIAWLPQQTVRYRQHGQNSLGAKPVDLRLRGLLSLRIHKWVLRSRIEGNIAQARALEERLARDLESPHRATVTEFVRLSRYGKLRRIYTVVQRGFWKTGALRNLVWLAKC